MESKDKMSLELCAVFFFKLNHRYGRSHDTNYGFYGFQVFKRNNSLFYNMIWIHNMEPYTIHDKPYRGRLLW